MTFLDGRLAPHSVLEAGLIVGIALLVVFAMFLVARVLLAREN